MNNVKINKKAFDNIVKYPNIAWHFFCNFSNENRADKNLKESQSTIHKRLKSWKDAGFMEESKEIIKRKTKPIIKGMRKGKNNYGDYEVGIFLLNLNPLFDYCNKKLPKNERLTKSEKKFLEKYFSPFIIRQRIYNYYSKDENVIDAMLKYFVFDFVIIYSGDFIIGDSIQDKIEKFQMFNETKGDVGSIFLDSKKKVRKREKQIKEKAYFTLKLDSKTQKESEERKKYLKVKEHIIRRDLRVLCSKMLKVSGLFLDQGIDKKIKNLGYLQLRDFNGDYLELYGINERPYFLETDKKGNLTGKKININELCGEKYPLRFTPKKDEYWEEWKKNYSLIPFKKSKKQKFMNRIFAKRE